MEFFLFKVKCIYFTMYFTHLFNIVIFLFNASLLLQKEIRKICNLFLCVKQQAYLNPSTYV